VIFLNDRFLVVDVIHGYVIHLHDMLCLTVRNDNKKKPVYSLRPLRM